MKQYQSILKWALITLLLVLAGSTGWYLIDRVQDNKIYHVIGVQDYLCAQSHPVQCQGKLNVVTRDGKPEALRIDSKTKFIGSNDPIEYRVNQSPFNAKLERDGNYVKRVTIEK